MKNFCRRVCWPCAAFCNPITQQCGLSAGDALDLKLDGQMWKASFGTASGLGKVCFASPYTFTAARGLLVVYWFAVMIWSMVDWVNSTAYPRVNGTLTDGSCPATWECGDGSIVNQTSAAVCEFVCTIDYRYGFWWTQLTHWTLILELFYLSFAFVTTALAHFSSLPDGTGDDTPWFVSVTWALQPAALVGSFLVFVLYWVLLFQPGDTVHAISVNTHGGNFAAMLIDVLICRPCRSTAAAGHWIRGHARPHLSHLTGGFHWICTASNGMGSIHRVGRQPLYLAHIYLPLAYAITFLGFTAIYYAAGGVFHQDLTSRYIYDVIDWSDPAGTGRLVGLIVLVGIPFIWCLLMCLFLGRRACTKGAEKGTMTNKTVPVPEVSA